MTKELLKHIEKRIIEEEKIVKELFNLDIKELSNQQLHNLITRCNWIISLRSQRVDTIMK